MTGGLRYYFIALLLISIAVCPTLAQTAKPEHAKTTPPEAAVDDATRMLQLGQVYMGQNNPDYADKHIKLDMKTRNDAGEQALRIFQQLTTKFPKFGDGWLWLGIALTETRQYSKKNPNGKTVRTPGKTAEALRAFRTACDCEPDSVINALYYGEAIMSYAGDFDGAAKFWEGFLKKAKTDMARVTALTQSARACLNKAYFGKIAKKLSAQDTKRLFSEAEGHVKRAAKLCPQAPDVKAMQSLLDKYRSELNGK